MRFFNSAARQDNIRRRLCAYNPGIATSSSRLLLSNGGRYRTRTCGLLSVKRIVPYLRALGQPQNYFLSIHNYTWVYKRNLKIIGENWAGLRHWRPNGNCPSGSWLAHQSPGYSTNPMQWDHLSKEIRIAHVPPRPSHFFGFGEH